VRPRGRVFRPRVRVFLMTADRYRGPDGNFYCRTSILTTWPQVLSFNFVARNCRCKLHILELRIWLGGELECLDCFSANQDWKSLYGKQSSSVQIDWRCGVSGMTLDVLFI
jgi:hypothetical protein